MSRTLSTTWSSVSRPSKEKQDFKLLHKRPEQYLIKLMDLQVIKHYNSAYGVRINEMDETALTDWTDNP